MGEPVDNVVVVIRDDRPRPTLSVVMPTRNRRSQLPVVLIPLLHDPLVEQLIVVVDASADGSIEWLRKIATTHPKLVPVFRAQRIGAQAARAEGLSRATGDVVLFLDDDVLAGDDLVRGHLTHHGRATGRVVIGYMPVALPPTRAPGQFASFLYATEYERRCSNYEADPTQILLNLWWGNVSMRRSDALSVGLVSPGFEHLYHEDQDFGLRCLAAGLEGVFDRSLAAKHLHTRDIDAFIRDARSQGAALVILHQRHTDLIGELHPADFADGLPIPAELLVRSCGRPLVASASSTVLRAVAGMTGKLGWYGIETRSGRALRRVNQRSGAETVWRNERTPTRMADGRGRS
jgi:GT2 family glycosyltransferase